MQDEKKVTPFEREPGPGTLGGRSTRALSIARLMDISNSRAIDLGSHEGHNSFDLHECGCREVIGLEARDRFVERANRERDKLGYNAVCFMTGDVRKIDEMGL
ncbi:MAG: class I SAM-dependent methyltransferase, partial [Gammaproteobacteria bacterium]|nr:class I SAM-dependent methyltransferase [Gammaproteobacteria bacterium]